MIAITFDIDWATDVMIADTLDLLNTAGVRATLFATHATSLFDGIEGHEIGIHPNFLLTKDYRSEFDRLMGLYPQAKGVRCHSYYQNTQILDLFVERGLRYDSNLLMFHCQGIHAFQNWNGLVRVPVFWEDDINYLVGGTWDPQMLSISNPNSLYVFAFHPVHVFLNTERIDRYKVAKPHCNDTKKLQEFVNSESSGVGTRVFFKKLLTLIEEKYSSQTLGEIVASLYTNLNKGKFSAQS